MTKAEMPEIKNIIKKTANPMQPYEVYAKVGKREVFRCSFSTEERAQKWIDDHGDMPVTDVHG